MSRQTRSLKRAVSSHYSHKTTLSLLFAACQQWCNKNTQPWKFKCMWHGMCRGCRECAVAAGAERQQNGECQKWCNKNTQPWKLKCTWPGACNGCPECAVAAGTERQQMQTHGVRADHLMQGEDVRVDSSQTCSRLDIVTFASTIGWLLIA